MAKAKKATKKKCSGLKGKGKLKKGYTWKGAKKGGCPVKSKKARKKR